MGMRGDCRTHKKLARMEGAGIATVPLAEPPFRRQWRTVETKAENVSAAALLLRLDPGPGGMDDDEIAAKRTRRGGGNVRRSVRVVLQQRVRPLAKDRAREIDVRALRVVALMQGEIEAFVLVPAGHQRHVAVRARGEDLRRRARQKPSIDDRAEAKPRARGENGASGEGAHFGDRTRSDLMHEVEAYGLSFLQRRQRAVRRREHRSALADNAREQPFG